MCDMETCEGSGSSPESESVVAADAALDAAIKVTRAVLLIQDPRVFEDLARMYAAHLTGALLSKAVHFAADAAPGTAGHEHDRRLRNVLPVNLEPHGWFLNPGGRYFPARDYALLLAIVSTYRIDSVSAASLNYPAHVFDLEADLNRALNAVISAAHGMGLMYSKFIVKMLDYFMATRLMPHGSPEIKNAVLRSCSHASSLTRPSLLSFRAFKRLTAVLKNGPGPNVFMHYVEQWIANSYDFKRRGLNQGGGMPVTRDSRLAQAAVVGADSETVLRALEARRDDPKRCSDLRIELVGALCVHIYGSKPLTQTARSISGWIKDLGLLSDKTAIKAAFDVCRVAAIRYSACAPRPFVISITVESLIKTFLYGALPEHWSAENYEDQLDAVKSLFAHAGLDITIPIVNSL